LSRAPCSRRQERCRFPAERGPENLKENIGSAESNPWTCRGRHVSVLTFIQKAFMAKTIMIVDDSTPIRQAIGAALTGAGYEVIEGCDGVDALGKLTGQKVHLIISDVNMPNMDGISFAKAVKQLPNYKFTPVIMLTTESHEAKRMEGQAAGAKAWVVKPFKAEQVLRAVEKLVLP